eukprot:910684_1
MGWFGENTEDMDPGDVFEDLEAGLHEHDRSARKAPQPSSGKHTILYAVLAVVGVLVGALIFYCVYTGQLPGFGPQTGLIQDLAVEIHTTNHKSVPAPEEFEAAAMRFKGLEASTHKLNTAPADEEHVREKLNLTKPQVESPSTASADTASQTTRVRELEIQLADKPAESVPVQEAAAKDADKHIAGPTVSAEVLNARVQEVKDERATSGDQDTSISELKDTVSKRTQSLATT